jgi:hypothetical protein
VIITRRRWVLGAIAITPAAAVAGDAWRKKPSEWSDKDVAAMLNRSPWAKAVTVEFKVGDIAKGPNQGTVAPPPPSGVNEPAGNRAQTNGNPIGGAPVGRGGIPAEASDLPKFQAVIRWESAVAIRRARKLDDSTAPPPAANHYVISVTGFPMMPRRAEDGDAESPIKAYTRLERPGHVTLHPAIVEIRKGGVLVLTFDATADPITDSDREVQVVIGTGSLEARVKFFPRDMIFERQMSL